MIFAEDVHIPHHDEQIKQPSGLCPGWQRSVPVCGQGQHGSWGVTGPLFRKGERMKINQLV